jgi:hypothetical protein
MRGPPDWRRLGPEPRREARPGRGAKGRLAADSPAGLDDPAVPTFALDDGSAAVASIIPPITSIPPITPIPTVAIPIRVDADTTGADPNILRRRFWYYDTIGEKYDACGNCRA